MKPNPCLLSQHLDYLKLSFLQTHHLEVAQQSAQQHWDHVEYLRRLIEGEYTERRQRVIERRLKARISTSLLQKFPSDQGLTRSGIQ